MNKRIVKTKIDKAESQLRYCFDLLSNFIKGNQIKKVIMEFQPVLAETLNNLMKFYQELCSIEKSLINKKSKLDYAWFSRRMMHLSIYKKAISETIGIGKCLGDSFAWFFYKNNTDELEKHLSHKKNGLFTVGTGGDAEVRFIKENYNISGCFVLYHGITNILRIGDFSLYAIDNGIIGIGELKSKKNDDNTISVYTHVFSKYKLMIEELGQRINSKEEKDAFDDERFKRQVKAIKSLLEKPISSIKHNNIYGHNAFSIIDNFYRVGQHKKVSKDKAVLAFGICSRRMKLSNSLLQKKKRDISLPNDLTKETIKILIKNSPYNQILIGKVDNILYKGQVPIVWWRTNIKTIEKIVFQQLKIITLYNPAHVYEYLHKSGFTITLNKRQAIIEKRKAGKRITIENLDFFNHLILTNFLSVEVVINILEDVIRKMDNGEVEPNTRVFPKMLQRVF